MSCITRILELKGDKEFLPIHDIAVIEGGGEYKGHEYLITFVDRGHRCGYVALKEKAFSKFEAEREDAEYYYPDLSCHGGITFYSEEHAIKSYLEISCKDIWVGFDAAHFTDKPDRQKAGYYFPYNELSQHRLRVIPDQLEDMCTERSYQYMEDQCKHIINQLVKIENGR